MQLQGWAGKFRSALGALVGQDRKAQTPELELIETLTLAPKKQLMLVRCGGLRFLVGTGADSVQTIVRVSVPGEGEERL